jgi:hypothetical protein
VEAVTTPSTTLVKPTEQTEPRRAFAVSKSIEVKEKDMVKVPRSEVLRVARPANADGLKGLDVSVINSTETLLGRGLAKFLWLCQRHGSETYFCESGQIRCRANSSTSECSL